MSGKWVRWGLAGLLVVWLGMQLVRPARTNPPVRAANTLQSQFEVPAAVGAILERGCADCHSNRTKWPWYSAVAPMSWLVANHVREGRLKMNLDEWDDSVSFKDICQEVRTGGMPMKNYLVLHPEARLSPADVQAVCAWTESQR